GSCQVSGGSWAGAITKYSPGGKAADPVNDEPANAYVPEGAVRTTFVRRARRYRQCLGSAEKTSTDDTGAGWPELSRTTPERRVSRLLRVTMTSPTDAAPGSNGSSLMSRPSSIAERTCQPDGVDMLRR